MKRFTITILALFLTLSAFSQVFNTASTLKPGKFALGLNPAVCERSFGLFLHGGVGIRQGIDLAVKYGIFDGYDYFGADLEWRLMSGKPSISLITGGHVWNDFGLDVGANISFPIVSNIQMYTGLDTDINFYDSDTQLLAWIPLGIEIPVKSGMSFMMDAEIPITSPSYFVFGGGVMFYF